MSSTLRDVRVALVAGLAAGAVVVAGQALGARAALARPDVSSAVPTPRLGDPVRAATTALERREAVYIVVATDDGLVVPGLVQQGVDPNELPQYKLYSPSSTGLRGAAWARFERQVLGYAAAYNVTLQLKGATAAL